MGKDARGSHYRQFAPRGTNSHISGVSEEKALRFSLSLIRSQEKAAKHGLVTISSLSLCLCSEE